MNDEIPENQTEELEIEEDDQESNQAEIPNDTPFANVPTPVSNALKIPDWTGQYVIRDQFRPIADALVKKYEELKHIRVNEILFVSNTTGKGADKDRHKLAQVAAIPVKWTEILYQFTGGNFYYLMEFFASNIHHLNREQYIALIYHELRHIGRDGKLMHHDIEDWSQMINALGIGWSSHREEFPDLLDDYVDWDSLIGRQQIQMSIEGLQDDGLREIGNRVLSEHERELRHQALDRQALRDQLMPEGIDSIELSTPDREDGTPGQHLKLVKS